MLGRRILPALLVLCAAACRAGDVLPELGDHLKYARACLHAGDFHGAVASCDLLLLPEIKIHIDGRDVDDCARRAVEDSLKQWSDLLSGEVDFIAVQDRRDADVVIRFAKQLGGGGRHFAGFTKWRREAMRKPSATWKLTADVQLRTIQPNGQPMTYEQLLHASLHEIGHVLGLADSSASAEVMAPLDLCRPNVRVEPQEVKALSAMRDKAKELRRQALHRLIASN